MMKHSKILLVALAAFSLASCKQEKTIKEIIADTKQATFTIYTYDEYGSPSGSGSGFFINEDGTGITNYHVLDGATKAIIKTSDSVEYEIGEIVASDKRWDIAKFKIDAPADKAFAYLAFANETVEQGDKVYNISAPLGLEHTVSEGIVSSLREDSHGQVVQITAPISPGSSGSAVLNERGDVIAVATFYKQGGQNLNFGVAIDDNKLASLTRNDLMKRNAHLKKNDEFIILNIPCDRDGNVTLHALEFKKDATVAYLSYTNLNMAYDNQVIWCELNKGDEGFMITDLERNKKYHVVSSTLGTDKPNGNSVALASNYRFKVYFPAIKDELNNIDVTYGSSSRAWRFTNIYLEDYRDHIAYDMDKYLKEYAYSTMHSGDLAEASSIFSSILDKDPEDVQALNAMGIISYVIDNNMDAYYYFTEAIETHPNNTLAYHNRAYLHKYQEDYKKALDDITKAINIDSAQPDNYVLRGFLYVEMKKYKDAINDLTKALESEDFKEEAQLYFYRALCYASTDKIKLARQDVQSAYNYTDDPELEDLLQDLWKRLH